MIINRGALIFNLLLVYFSIPIVAINFTGMQATRRNGTSELNQVSRLFHLELIFEISFMILGTFYISIITPNF